MRYYLPLLISGPLQDLCELWRKVHTIGPCLESSVSTSSDPSLSIQAWGALSWMWQWRKPSWDMTAFDSLAGTNPILKSKPIKCCQLSLCLPISAFLLPQNKNISASRERSPQPESADSALEENGLCLTLLNWVRWDERALAGEDVPLSDQIPAFFFFFLNLQGWKSVILRPVGWPFGPGLAVLWWTQPAFWQAEAQRWNLPIQTPSPQRCSGISEWSWRVRYILLGSCLCPESD